jgi:hypothetical protein
LTPATVSTLITVILLLSACSVGRHHTSDSQLTRNFINHEAEFEVLLSEVQKDVNLTMIDRNEAQYAGRVVIVKDGFLPMERIGLSEQGWRKYQKFMQDLGLARIIMSQDLVEFRVYNGSLFNGDSYKGYEYRLGAARHPKISLDDYRVSAPDRESSGGYYVSRQLKGHWRLYLFVNG